MAHAHTRPRRWSLVAATAVAAVVVARSVHAQSPPVEELRRELDAMRHQMEEMQHKIEAQQRKIDALSAQPATPASAAPVAPPPPVAAAAPAPAPAPAWTPSQPLSLVRTGTAYLNISFDGLLDAGWSTTADVPRIETGDHDPLQRGFTVSNEEIFFDGAVDPYFRGVADIVFKLDENNDTDVELEEAYLLTSALPWNLQAKAGQFFTEFGRINTQHPHAWDFVDQPLVIGRMFGPEGLRNPGARLSWLVPTPFYSELFVALQNSQGETAFSFRNEGETLFGRPPVTRPVRNPGDLLWAPRYAASFDLTDSQTVVAGLSGAFSANASANDTRTQIYGGDLYWKWKPPWQAGGFPFVAFQTEALGRRYQAGAAGTLPRENLYDWGTYAQLLYGFTQRWVAGMRGEWVSGDRGAFDPDPNRADRFRWSPDLTFYPSEFSKIRLQYNFDHGQLIGGDQSSVWLQLEFLLGAHAAHKF